ncbi:MAG TPA: hypothetical protein DCY40_05930 [Actinobacteria bacterium]|nr:hypothetical protein [Actinomycetota bacterium]
MAPRTTCPSCRGKRALRRVVYGFPPGPDLEGERNLIFAGCTRGDDDPPYGCSICGAEVWPHGVFSFGDDSRHLRLDSLEWVVHSDRGMSVTAGDGGGLLLGVEDAETLGLMLALESFGDGETLVAWLHQHHLRFDGDAIGPLERFGFSAEGFVASGRGGEVTVPTVSRLLLAMLRGVLGDAPFDLADAVSWLEEHAVTPAVLVPD